MEPHTMTNEVGRALRFRNYAEELRVIASEARPETRASLFKAATEYDEMAKSLEAIIRTKITTGQQRPA
jgi:hypothetical protein